MSAFSQRRIVHFQGFLQGCTRGTSYLGLGVGFVPQVVEDLGQKDLWSASPVRATIADAYSARGSVARWLPPNRRSISTAAPRRLADDSQGGKDQEGTCCITATVKQRLFKRKR